MTLKEKAFATELAKPENKLNIAECMRKAHYSPASVRAGSKYRQLRKITQKLDFFSPERIKRDIEYTYKLAKKQKDLTNLSRNVEHRSKIAGMITDKQELTNKNPDKIIIAYGNKPTENTIPQVVEDKSNG